MKLSILTTITDPEKRQDPYLEAISCYMDFADEIVIVNGGNKDIYQKIAEGLNLGDIQQEKIKIIEMSWPAEWSWEELPKHLNAGLATCTGDWIIKLDIDQFFHENNIEEIRSRLSRIHKNAAGFQKYSIYPHKKFNQKGNMVIAVRNGQGIKFGEVHGRYTDLCTPINVLGKNEQGVPTGAPVSSERTGVTVWNFDYTFKTLPKARSEFARFSRAYKRYFKDAAWGNNDEESWNKFTTMMKARVAECSYTLSDYSILPKYIRKRYFNIDPLDFGHSGWGVI